MSERTRPGSGADGRGPVFLAGADRSGIGLLGELLEGHPDLAMSRRTDFWQRYCGRYGDLGPADVDRCLTDMAADRRWRDFSPDRAQVLADLEVCRSDAQLFASLQRQRMERLGKTRWGDKSLGSEIHADRILSAFPTAMMVHVIRDPRDRYASQKLHRGASRGGASAGAALWRDSVRLADRHALRYPTRYRTVRYEALVRDPEGTLEELCGWLGLPGGAELAATTVLHTRSIGRYRTDLTLRELTVIEDTTRGHLGGFGYRPEPPVPQPRTVRWSTTFWRTVDRTGVALWTPWSRLSQRLAAAPPPRAHEGSPSVPAPGADRAVNAAPTPPAPGPGPGSVTGSRGT
jgi:hypothetical protein